MPVSITEAEACNLQIGSRNQIVFWKLARHNAIISGQK